MAVSSPAALLNVLRASARSTVSELPSWVTGGSSTAVLPGRAQFMLKLAQGCNTGSSYSCTTRGLQGWCRSAHSQAQQNVPNSKARRISIPVGFLAGLFGSVVGVGGGVLISPIIASACRSLPQKVISGTSLAAVTTTGTAAGYIYWQAGAVDLTSSSIIAVSAVLTAPLGAHATGFVNCQVLRRCLGWWLILVSTLLPLRSMIFAAHKPAQSTSQEQPAQAGNNSIDQVAEIKDAPMKPAEDLQLWAKLTLAATGCLAGFASGLLGIGGGTIVTPLLALCTSMPQLHVMGSSLTAMVLPSLVALSHHHRLGNVDWVMAAGLASGTVAGSYLGSTGALAAPPGVLEACFSAGMFLLGWRTLAMNRTAVKQLPRM